MDKTYAVLEMTSTSLKLVVGYVLNEEPIILHTEKKLIPNLIKNGKIIDKKTLISEINKLTKIEDQFKKFSINIRDVILILPPIAFERYILEKNLALVSSSHIVQKADVFNVISLMKGYEKGIKNGNILLDIIPSKFLLDGTKAFAFPPVGNAGSSLGISAKFHTLPSSIVKDYQEVAHLAGMRPIRSIISSYCMANYLNKKEGLPKNYFYVDIGSSVTTITLCSGNDIYDSSYFLMGGETLTNVIRNKFGISFEDAERLKINFGYDMRELKFDPIILKTTDEYDQEISFKLSELNSIVKDFLGDFVFSLNNCFTTLLQKRNYSNSYCKLPFVIGGGGSKLFGLFEYMKLAFKEQKIYYVPLDIIGLRDESFLNAAGAFLIVSQFKGCLQEFEKETGFNPVSRINTANSNERKIFKLNEGEEL